MLANQRIEPERSLALMEEAVTLARLSGDGLAIGLATEWRGSFACWMGNIELAEACYIESRAAFGALPQQPWIARNLTLVDARFAWIAFARGDLIAAESISLRALERMRALEREHNAPYPYASDALTTLGLVAYARGDHAAAVAHHQAALRVADHTSDLFGVLYTLMHLASTLTALGRGVDAARAFGAAQAICERLGLAFYAVWANARMMGAGMSPWPDDALPPAAQGEAAPTGAMDLHALSRSGPGQPLDRRTEHAGGGCGRRGPGHRSPGLCPSSSTDPYPAPGPMPAVSPRESSKCWHCFVSV